MQRSCSRIVVFILILQAPICQTPPDINDKSVKPFFWKIRQMVSSTFHSIPVLHRPSTREDLKNFKGILMVFFLCCLVQASSPLGLGACKDLLNTAKEVHPFLF